MVGFYSLSMHTLNAPHFGMWINLARLAVVILAVVTFARSLIDIAVIVSVVMVAGEFTLMLALRARRRV